MARRFMSNNPKWRGGKPIDNSEKTNITNKKLSSLEPKKEIKRVYSDIDPYGEEDWEE